jgi:V8-like Glu-specific endopeptidase
MATMIPPSSNQQNKSASSFGAFIEAAYSAHDRQPNSLTPDIFDMPDGWRNSAWITMKDFTPLGGQHDAFYGFIAVDKSGRGTAVLALRGTVGWLEWFDDFIVTMQPFRVAASSLSNGASESNYGSVSTGFAKIYGTLQVIDAGAPTAATATESARLPVPTIVQAKSFAEAVASVINRERRNGFEAAVPTIVTGHSLGAALATLYALQNTIEVNTFNATVYTFGSPRVGDEAFVNAYNERVRNTYRFANIPDLVPETPFKILGYSHVDHECLLDSRGKGLSTPSCAHAMSTYRALLDDRPITGACAPNPADELAVAPPSTATEAASVSSVSPASPAAIAAVPSRQPTSTVPASEVTALRRQTLFGGAQTKERLAALAAADPHPSGLDYERILGTSELLDLNWFDRGLRAAGSVCRIVLQDDAKRTVGFATGFLVAPGIVMTNNHVIADEQGAANAFAQFDYEFDVDGSPRPTFSFSFAPKRYFFTSPLDELDFTLIAVSEMDSSGNRTIGTYNYLRLDPRVGKITVGEWMTIIQHPSGQFKEVAARENQLLQIGDRTLLYATDTAPGSSGSPVFNDSWQVVALHHAGVPDVDANGITLGPDGKPAPANASDSQVHWLGNEGIRISQIVAALRNAPTHAQRDLILAIADGTNRPAAQNSPSAASSNGKAAVPPPVVPQMAVPAETSSETGAAVADHVIANGVIADNAKAESVTGEIFISESNGRVTLSAPIGTLASARFRS